jgi:hypothetical protein
MFDPTLPITAIQTLALQTRKGHPIINSMNPTDTIAGVDLRIADLRVRHHTAKHRPVGPSARYNCHGLVFAARRTGISDPAEVLKILTDDGYSELRMKEKPLPGDIAIYREEGDIVHSGIVMWVKADEPWILGKWGDCHEVIHSVMDCPYIKAVVTYYRLPK